MLGFVFSNRCPYVYGQTTLSTIRQNESQIAQKKVDGTFGAVNTIAVMIPAGDYEREGRLLRDLEAILDQGKVHGGGKVQNIPEVQTALVGKAVLGGDRQGLFQ